MSQIIVPGHYPEDNKIECEDCHCLFKFYNTEIHTDITTPDEMDLLGGFGVHKWVECPQCKHHMTLSCTFTESRPFEDFMNFFRNIFKRKGEDNDGKNRDIKSKQ